MLVQTWNRLEKYIVQNHAVDHDRQEHVFLGVWISQCRHRHVSIAQNMSQIVRKAGQHAGPRSAVGRAPDS